MSMATADPYTLIPVRTTVLEMLRPFKTKGGSWEDALLDFLEEHAPEEFGREMIRRSETMPSIPWARGERTRRGR